MQIAAEIHADRERESDDREGEADRDRDRVNWIKTLRDS